MAETAVIIDDMPETQDADRALTIDDILKVDNVAEYLDDALLGRIGQDVTRDYQIDIDSRKDWEQRYKRALDVAMQVRKAKTFPWPGAHNVKYPLLTVAAIQFQARAYPAIVDGSNLVKARVLGQDDGTPVMVNGPQGPQPAMQQTPDGPAPIWKIPPGAKQDRADRVSQHMTWQLLYRMEDWEEDTDRLLLMLPIVGCVFRKTYYDPICATNVSQMVPADDFVVNYWTKSLSTCPRMTHVLRLYPHEAQERIASGLWRKVPLESRPDDDKADPNDDTAPIRFYEQHRLIDLDGDGYPEPYIVTTTEDGAIARITAGFSADDVKVANGRILRIERRQYFTKYGFIPAPDGSFYDIGFGTLLDDISAAIDNVLNQILDAGALANAQGGFVGSGVNIKSGDMRFRLGEWKRLDTSGMSLKDSIYPLQLPGPSAVLFQLLGMLIEAAKQITSVQDILTGGPATAQTATTTLNQVEQGMKVFTGIYKRIHRAFRQELKILYGLNRDYLQDEEYFNLADTPGVVERKDYESKDLDIVPVSDPGMASDMQKLAKAQYLAVFNGNPLINQEESIRRQLEAASIPDIKALMTVPQAQPDPKLLLDAAKMHMDRDESMATIRSKDAASVASIATAAGTLAEMGIITDAATLAGEAVRLGMQVMAEIGGDNGPQPDGGPGNVPAMAGAPGNGGIPPVSPGLPDSPGGAMGIGGGAGPGSPATGSVDGAAGGPVLG